MSQEIKDAGNKYGFLTQTIGDPYHFYPIQTAFGGYIFGQNADGSYNAEDLGLNSEGSVAALEWLNSMYEDGLLDRNGNIDGDLMWAFDRATTDEALRPYMGGRERIGQAAAQ